MRVISDGKVVFEDCQIIVSGAKTIYVYTVIGTEFRYAKNYVASTVFPDNLEVIPAGTFAGCTSLKEIVIPASVKVIEDGAFEGCTSLEKITFVTEEKTVEVEVEVEVEGEEPEITTELVTVYTGLETLGVGVFRDCPLLVEVVLPITLTEIDELAFDNAELIIYAPMTEEEKPEGWADNCFGEATVEWAKPEEPEVDEPEADEEE